MSEKIAVLFVIIWIIWMLIGAILDDMDKKRKANPKKNGKWF